MIPARRSASMAWSSSNESKVPLCSADPLWLCPPADLCPVGGTRRMEQLQNMKSVGHGQYREVTDEKEVIRLSA